MLSSRIVKSWGVSELVVENWASIVRSGPGLPDVPPACVVEGVTENDETSIAACAGTATRTQFHALRVGNAGAGLDKLGHYRPPKIGRGSEVWCRICLCKSRDLGTP